MSAMFDMIVGSETGAIIATTLVVPEEKGSKVSKFYGDKAVKFFEDNIDVLYVDTKMTAGAQVFICFLFLAIFGAITYKVAEVYFRNPTQDDRLVELTNLLKLFKKLKKGKISEDEQEFKDKLTRCEELMGESSGCKDMKL
jgi:hypothetical protein